MRKHLKAIASAIMAVFMLTALFCTPAMAAERAPEANDVAHSVSMSADPTAKSEEGTNSTSDWPWRNLVDVVSSYNERPTLTSSQQLLATNYFSRTVKGVAVTLECKGSSSAKVNFYIRSISNGKIWEFDGRAGETTTKVFSSDVPVGNYEIWAKSATYTGAYSVQIRFVAPKS